MAKAVPDTRQQILRAALREFAQYGYAGASVQQIVTAAGVTKPALYYYYSSKAELYGTLLDWAFEERYRLMRRAAAGGGTIAEQLTRIAAVSFAFVRNNRELMRLAFATAFMAPGEVPGRALCVRKVKRHLQFIRGLMDEAAARGEVNRQFDSDEMASGFFGLMTFYVVRYLAGIVPTLSPRCAQRIVELHLKGTGPS
jgi:AcrR family transcriptional regulator